MSWKDLVDRTTLLVAFLAVLAVYCALELHGASETAASALRDIMLALAGALAGISIPRGGSGGGQ